jgi:hypothetical protein
VRRGEVTLAPLGTFSPTKSTPWNLPMPRSWSSEPPMLASASNLSVNGFLKPKRVSRRWLVPPMAPFGPTWQVAQEASLNTGPRPSSTVSTSANSSWPASNRA